MSSMSGSVGLGPKGPKGYGNKTPQGYSQGQIKQYTPEQDQLYQNSFAHAAPDSFTARLASGDQSMFEEMEAPAMRQFQGLQGQMASRFSRGGGQGSLGTRKSSGFQNEMSSAASNFAQNLRSERVNLQRQAVQDLRGLTSDLLNYRPYENVLTEKPTPWYENAAVGFASGVGEGVGKKIGGG